MADGRVSTGVGQHLGPVDGHGDASHFEHPAARAQLDDPRETARQQFAIFPAEGANRVVIGMGVGAEQAHGHEIMGRRLDLPAGKDPRGVAVNEQPEQDGWRVLGVAGAALVDPHAAQVEFADGIYDEVDKMTRRRLLPEVRREQEWRVVVDMNETGGHTL